MRAGQTRNKRLKNKERTWDNELAQIAQRWADQCNFNHDKCRDVDGFLVGQNIAINYRSDKYASEISQHIDRWYEEVAFMKKEFVSSFPEVTTEVIGHYTQLVYAETRYIG
ncbi:unnamed protein product [Timema podura]|uniref:SCP domain-containing protein n=1 Tax=Timema podura TaxID=61482 RepID=A0ABN7P1C5_TIMPD|nr:unnamed protein product [Timema podura]